MQTEKSDGIHGHGVIVYGVAARHVHARGAALHIGVGQNGEYAVRPEQKIAALRAVARGVDVFNARPGFFVYYNASVYLAARLLDELGVGANADREDEYVKFHGLTAFHISLVTVEFHHAVGK